MSTTQYKPYSLSWHEFQAFRRNQLDAIMRLTTKLGRVAHVKIFGANLHLISEPDVIRELLLKHAQQLHREPITSQIFGRIIGQGVFVAEGEAWQRQRKLIQPVFHAAHIHDFAATFAEYAQEMCASWAVGTVRQLDQEMMALALRIICKTMFGTDIADQTTRIGELMQVVMTEAEAQLRFGFPLPDWLPTPGLRRQKRAVSALKAILLEFIHDHQRQIEQGNDPADLLAMLLTARDEAGQPLSKEQILDECLTIFVAGHETTAVALTWAWVLLLQHPTILEKLTREVDAAVGKAPVTYDALNQMPYLSQVTKEVLRYYPPAPGFGRTPLEPFTIYGHTFKRGDTIIVSSYTMHHQSELYPEPETFCPERFAADAEQPARYAYIPFGAGPRTCIGNAFATLEMQVVLATMVQSLRLSLAPEQEIVPETLVTLRPKGGVRMRVEEQNIKRDA